MTESPKPKRPPANTPPPRRRWWWRWTRRLALLGVVCCFFGVIVLFAGRAYVRSVGTGDRDAEIAKLNAEEPGWRFAEYCEAQEKAAPLAEQNSALVVQRAYELIPVQWNEWSKRPRLQPEEWVPLNQKHLLADLTGGDELFAGTRNARAVARTLRERPRGYTAHTFPEIPIQLRLPELDRVRAVTNLLRADALVGAQTGDQVRGWRSARAILNCGRSVQEAPCLISPLVRIASGRRSAEAAMRLLALGESKDALPEMAALQTALLAEANEPLFHNGLRGELAVMDRFFEDLSNGKLSADDLAGLVGKRSGFPDEALFYLRRGLFPGDHACYLKYMRGFLEAARGPEHELQKALARVEEGIHADRGSRALFMFSQLLTPACAKVGAASLNHRAELRSAAVLIACERFRLARGHWPDSLAEIPKELLPAIPLDPYDGTPLKFAKLPDGIAVYTIGEGNQTDDPRKRLTSPLGGGEIGWRLFDPKERGLPPLPKEMPELAPGIALP
ncbi:MAG TPA: hypothetical protein VGE74_14085 [Gemmata sp.]